MIKKISALVIALVLCLSVVVMPVAAGFDSDYTLPSGAKIAWKVELDKSYYKAGETAKVNVYLYCDPDIQITTGALFIGMNSAVFSTTDNTNEAIKESGKGNGLFESFFKAGNQLTYGWQLTSTIIDNIESGNTAEENAAYDQYLKVSFARNTTGGSHPNAKNLKLGLPGSEINAQTDPFLSFDLVVRSDVTDGTAINVGIPTGSFTPDTSAKNWSTTFKVLKDPGVAQTSTNTNKSTTDTTIAPATATIGAASIISPLSTQIRFNGPEKGDTKAPFDVRTRATVSKADFAALLNTTVENVETVAKDKKDALRVGFVYMSDSADGDYDEAVAKAAAIAGEDAPGYKVVDVSYIQRSGDNYVWTCFIAGPDYTDGVNALAYIICDGCEPQFKTVDATTFSELYDAAKAAGIIPKA